MSDWQTAERDEFDAWWRTTTYGASRQHVAWEAWKAAWRHGRNHLVNELHEVDEQPTNGKPRG